MSSNLELDRPVASIDIEATGTSPRADRIVELAIIKLFPDGRKESHVFRVNPEMPIPPEVTAIHGITDADVADSPCFDDVAAKVLDILEGCDLLGYNLLHFDIPMLTEEFIRARIRFDLGETRVIDAQRIFHKKEPRDLTAALAYYCGEVLEGAHGAEADADATLRVVEAQVLHYPDLPRDLDGLDRFCNPRDPDWVDRMGRLRWLNGEVVINFGRKRGASLRDLVDKDPGYLKWILNSNFPRDTRETVRLAMDGVYPSPPATSTSPAAD